MAAALVFAEAVPAAAAAGLDGGSVHLWRLAHGRAQRRGPLRRLLGAYLGMPPDALDLREDQRGKPCLPVELARRANALPLEFNWSHSGDLALVALARGVAPGVDIERHHARARALELARRFFDPAEAAMLERLRGDARDRAFLGLWCAKEAVLKATGEGLAFGLARLAFRQHPAGWRIERLDAALGEPRDWQLSAFEPAAGYHGALAWRGSVRKIHAFSLAQA